MSQQDTRNGTAASEPFGGGDSLLLQDSAASTHVGVPSVAQQQATARRQIRDMTLDLVRAMETGNPSQPPQIPLVPRPVGFRVSALDLEHGDSPFASIRSLVQTLRVMQVVHDHLAVPLAATQPLVDTEQATVQELNSSSNVATPVAAPQRPLFMTRRDIYYQDPDLFGSQRTVDAIVSSLSLTVRPHCEPQQPVLGIDPQQSSLLDASHLGVVASSRGVALGSCKIHLHASTINSPEQSIIDLGPPGSTGVLLPPGAQILRVDLDADIAWVLIIEKDATFQTLAQQDFPRACTPPGLIVTSRGFPDIATRQFLRMLPDTVHIHTLVDADPFGIHIHWMYEQALMGRAVTHLGVHLTDVLQLVGGQEKVSYLVDGDLKRIKYLMGNEGVRCQVGLMRTLQIMLHLRVKAEIQALGGQLLPFLYHRLQAQPVQPERQPATPSTV